MQNGSLYASDFSYLIRVPPRCPSHLTALSCMHCFRVCKSSTICACKFPKLLARCSWRSMHGTGPGPLCRLSLHSPATVMIPRSLLNSLRRGARGAAVAATAAANTAGGQAGFQTAAASTPERQQGSRGPRQGKPQEQAYNSKFKLSFSTDAATMETGVVHGAKVVSGAGRAR